MTQTERISNMERHLDRAAAALRQLSSALDSYEEARQSLAALDSYYGSDDWKADYAADEAGRLPATLKRGVLSEDAVWNLLDDNRQLAVRMRTDAECASHASRRDMHSRSDSSQ